MAFTIFALIQMDIKKHIEGLQGEGSLTAEIFRNGANAHRAARDYKREIVEIPADRRLEIYMAPGGGFVARIYKSSDI